MKKGRENPLYIFRFVLMYESVYVCVGLSACLSVCLWVCIHQYRCSQSPVEGVRSPGAAIIGKCKRQAIAVENLGPL